MFRRMTRERYLSDAELAAFMRAIRERRHVHRERDRAFFGLIANVGIRPEECRALKRADLHLSARHPWIHVARVHPPHAPRPTCRIVINRDVAKMVSEYVATLPVDGELFPFTKRQSRRLFHYYAEKSGLAPKRKAYALRHSAGMRLWRYTKDLRLMQAIMGHIRLKATMGYIHAGGDALVAAQSTIESL